MVHTIGLHVILVSLAWDFPGLTLVLALPSHFLNSHVVMGFILGLGLGFHNISDLGEVVLGKFQGLGMEMVLFKKPLKGRWR